MFAGRIQPLKAPDVLLRAVARRCSSATRRCAPRLVVPVVGGPSGSGLEHPESLAQLAASLGIDDVVRFVPPVAQSELADWYAAATLVCVPSYNESFGLVAVEAAGRRHARRGGRRRRADHRGARRPLRAARRGPRPGRLRAGAMAADRRAPGLRAELSPGRACAQAASVRLGRAPPTARSRSTAAAAQVDARRPGRGRRS